LFRLLAVYGTVRGQHSGAVAIEGTWTLLAAGGALLVCLVYRIVAFPDDQPGAPERARPVVSEALRSRLALFSGGFAVAAALLAAAAIFPPYVAVASSTLRNVHGLMAYQATLAAALLVTGWLLLTRQRRIVGATALVVVTLLMGVERLTSLLGSTVSANQGTGSSLADAASYLAVIGATIAVVVIASSDRGEGGAVHRAPLRTWLTVFLGLALAVGLASDYLGFRGLAAPHGFPSPPGIDSLTPVPNSLTTTLLVVMAVFVVGLVGVSTDRRAVATGIVLGLTALVVAVAFYRLLVVYSDLPSGLVAIEGTWILLAAGPAVLLGLGSRLVSPPTRRPRLLSGTEVWRRLRGLPAGPARSRARGSGAGAQAWRRLRGLDVV
jgi:hypothetical protein